MMGFGRLDRMVTSPTARPTSVVAHADQSRVMEREVRGTGLGRQIVLEPRIAGAIDGGAIQLTAVSRRCMT
jgi:hypothetical protein